MAGLESSRLRRENGPIMVSAKPVLTSFRPEDLEQIFAEWGEPKFRARQVLDWVYRKRVTRFEEMTNLGLSLRERLMGHFDLRSLTLARQQGSADTTRKLLFRLRDGRYVESVVIPANPTLYGERADRRTICVSSQVGCAYDCKFCASGLAGFTRNLTPDEIVEQILQAEAMDGQRIDNIVFMGMGEPLANLRNLLAAIEILNADWGVGIGARHMTISTSGLAPQIEKLAEQPLQVRLALSLHGATDEVRDQIMPVNKKYPLNRLFESLRRYQELKKQKVTFEYILIEDVNDALEQAAILATRARSLNAKVNLIPYNTVEGLPWKRPSETRQEQFLKVLRTQGVQATLRREKGHDIDAACGQLRLKEEKGGVIAEAI
jgi:23S rRNA (adenine2503-C2)-methyltransferase